MSRPSGTKRAVSALRILRQSVLESLSRAGDELLECTLQSNVTQAVGGRLWSIRTAEADGLLCGDVCGCHNLATSGHARMNVKYRLCAHLHPALLLRVPLSFSQSWKTMARHAALSYLHEASNTERQRCRPSGHSD